jgi:hypothetical protein
LIEGAVKLTIAGLSSPSAANAQRQSQKTPQSTAIEATANQKTRPNNNVLHTHRHHHGGRSEQTATDRQPGNAATAGASNVPPNSRLDITA